MMWSGTNTYDVKHYWSGNDAICSIHREENGYIKLVRPEEPFTKTRSRCHKCEFLLNNYYKELGVNVS